MTSLEDLRIFDRVAARTSFSAAARELRLSPAAVTRRIASLEKDLGVRLLTRTTRQVRLTQDGETFFERCRQILASLDEAFDEMRTVRAGPQGTLRLTAPLSFGRRRIAPIVREFQAAYPGVAVSLCLSDSDDDLGPRDTDVAIRVGPPQHGAFITRRILCARRVVVASPAYLERHGTPACPADLADHKCLVVLRDDQPLDHWMFMIDGRMESIRVPAVLASNSGEVVQSWALAGAGIALKSLWDLEEDLAAGRLVEILGDAACDTADLFLVYPDRRNLPARVRSFIDFLTERMDAIGGRVSERESPAPPESAGRDPLPA